MARRMIVVGRIEKRNGKIANTTVTGEAWVTPHLNWGTAYIMPKYRFVSEGRDEFTEYVTILDRGDNPIEYNVPIDRANREYGE